MTIGGGTIQPNGTFTPAPGLALPTSGSTVTCTVGPLSAALVQVTAPAAVPLTVLSSASGLGMAAPESYASAYGNNLASSVSLRDSAGVAFTPTLTYTSSTQINFEVPAGIAIGAAVVTIGTQSAALQIAATAPGLFTLNSSGLAAAYAIRVSTGGVQSVVSIFTEQGGSYVAVPIDVNQADGQVYLILYGTGIRGAGNNVTVTVGGINAQVIYSGPQGEFAALDQINVLLPSQLAGSGTANIVLTADGAVANAVNVAIQ
jgi:uncharacterized protein (TIGR03437 family)